MKPSILITGGNQGVGKDIFEYFSPNAHSMSRTNGYDIKSSKARSEIIQKSFEYDIFLNHAHSGHFEGQTSLLYEIYEAWSKAGKKGYIFSTGSFATYAPQQDFKRYSVIKRALEIANQQCCKKIENGFGPFRMTLLKPGMLDSEANRNHPQVLNGRDMALLIESLYFSPPSVLINEVVLSGVKRGTHQFDTP